MRIITALSTLVVLTVLYACELPVTNPEPEPRYAVSYHANGADAGTVPVDSRTYKAGEEVTVRDNQGQLSRTAFSFGGWNTAADGRGTTLSPGQSLSMGKKNLEFFALWTPKTHVIRFEPNGGWGTLASLTANEGLSTPLPANTFVRPGFLFKGWNTDAQEGGTSWADQSSVTIGTADLTLYAIWVPGQNSLSFQANGASGVMDNRTVATGGQATLPLCSYIRMGYSFTGWSTLSGGGGTTYADGATLTMGETSIVLFAQWSPNTYQVSFDPNGGQGSMIPRSEVFGSDITLPPSSFSRQGYSFQGWNTQADGKGEDYSVGDTLVLGASSPTLYALWKVNSYPVSFHSNGGEGSMAAQSEPFGKTWNLPPATFTKAGHSFQGWSLFSTGAGSRYADASSWTTGDQPVVLFAIWSPNSYQVRFHANGGTGTMQPQAFTYGTPGSLAAVNFTNGGLVFSGWSTSPGGPPVWADGAGFTPGLSDQELYACWSSSVTIGWGPYAALAFTPGTATVGQGQTVTLEAAAAGGSAWRWYIDNTLVAGQSESSYSFSSTVPGHHLISVFTVVAGIGYSGTITIQVNQ